MIQCDKSVKQLVASEFTSMDASVYLSACKNV